MSTVYALHHNNIDVTLFEKNDRLGGHSRTIDVTMNDKTVPVDTGFIVFNYRNYLHLTALFDHLDVGVEKSDMSFGADIADGWLQYSSKNVFRRFSNLLRPHYWKMIFDVVKFNKRAPEYLTKSTDITIKDCLNELKMGQWFRDYYLQAMGAAIWSCPISKIEHFPAKTFVRFFQNHGLLTLNDHPQWYTVTGGSRNYITKLTADFKNKIRLGVGVKAVTRDENGVSVTVENGDTEQFDQVVFACHADQAIAMLDAPTITEQDIIGSFTYQKNKIVTHSDLSFMPKDKSCWASWVYLSKDKKDDTGAVALSYWMNNLQNFDTEKPVIITLNPPTMPGADVTYDINHFDHPVFTRDAIDAQEKISAIQGQNKTWYVGAYQRYGFHEDGILSAANIIEQMGLTLPWQDHIDPDKERKRK